MLSKRRGDGMAEIREKHPSWFKMKIERRELVRQLSPETAVNVLLACWDFLETGEKPPNLSPIENVAFASFIPDMEEAWSRYLQRVSNGGNGGRPSKNHTVPYGTDRVHTGPYGTEGEIEGEPDPLFLRNKDRGCVADKPPTPTHVPRKRFVPPTLEEVSAYVRERGSKVDPQGFIDFYASKGWLVGKAPMKDWKAACRNAEKWERWDKRPATGDRDRVKTEADYVEELFFYRDS